MLKILFKKAYPTFKVALLEVDGQEEINLANIEGLGIKELFFVLACPGTETKDIAAETTTWAIDGQIELGDASKSKQTLLVIGNG